MVPMKNKITQFPKLPHIRPRVPIEQPMVLFTFGDQRFGIQWIVTELSAEPADVISIQEQRQKKAPRLRSEP
jgi:hypothetical protein